MSVIEVADACVDPGAVVVHFHDTAGTPPAVVGPRGLVTLTLGTELQLGAGSGLLRPPVGRDVAGAYTES